MRPPVRYAKSATISIAYQVTGDGPPAVVLAPGTGSHLDLEWEWPPRARYLEQLASFCRLIRFDKRGTGLSDRPTSAATLEERTDDIRAVMDAAGSQAAFVFGVSEGANMACLFAATFPQRTRGLIVWGGQARWVKTTDYPWGPSREEKEREIQRLSENGIDLEYLFGPGAGLGPTDDPESVRGIAVHLAARIAAQAGPNEILVSSTVRDLVVGSGLAFEDRGDHVLKGVGEARRVFSVVTPAPPCKRNSRASWRLGRRKARVEPARRQRVHQRCCANVSHQFICVAPRKSRGGH